MRTPTDPRFYVSEKYLSWLHDSIINNPLMMKDQHLFSTELEHICCNLASSDNGPFAVAYLAALGLDIPEISLYSEKVIELAQASYKKVSSPLDGIRSTFDYLWGNFIEGYQEHEFSLAHVLDTGVGNCLGLTELVAAVCQLQGYHLQFETAPGHIFLSYHDFDQTVTQRLSGGFNVTRTERFTPIESTSPLGIRVSYDSERKGWGMAKSLASVYRWIVEINELGSEARVKAARKALDLDSNEGYRYIYGQASFEFGRRSGDAGLMKEAVKYISAVDMNDFVINDPWYQQNKGYFA